MTRFRSITILADQQGYMLSLIARQTAVVEAWQNKLTDYAGYVGTKEAAATKLAEARTLLDTFQAKLIEAITAQAAD